MKQTLNYRRCWRIVVLAACVLALSANVAAQGPLKVTEDDARAAVVNKVAPVYPPMARQMRIMGKVLIETIVDPDGKVEDCQPVSGNPLLTGAAVAAVKRWSFKPFTDGGKPAKAVTRLTFEFTL